MMELQDIEKRIVMDTAIKRELEQCGDNESALHDVEHHFIAASNETAHGFIALGQQLGFAGSSVSTALDDKGETWFVFDLVSRRDTRMPDVLRESILMLLLADVHAVIYDGWGTFGAK